MIGLSTVHSLRRKGLLVHLLFLSLRSSRSTIKICMCISGLQAGQCNARESAATIFAY